MMYQNDGLIQAQKHEHVEYGGCLLLAMDNL